MKTRFFLTSIILLLAYFSISAAVIKEKRELKNFDGIRVSAGIDVQFTQENSYLVEIEADDQYIEDISTEIKGSTLIIGWKPNNKRNRRTSKKTVIYVKAPQLYEVSASGGSDFYSDNIASDKAFKISASGGADIDIKKLEINDNLSISTSGGSDCNIKELSVQNCNASASGGADVIIQSMKADELKVSASGGSDIKMQSITANKLQASASGGADILIKGDIKEQNTSSSGGGCIYINGKKTKITISFNQKGKTIPS